MTDHDPITKAQIILIVIFLIGVNVLLFACASAGYLPPA